MKTAIMVLIMAASAQAAECVSCKEDTEAAFKYGNSVYRVCDKCASESIGYIESGKAKLDLGCFFGFGAIVAVFIGGFAWSYQTESRNEEYNGLVDRYNELTEKSNKLGRMNSALAETNKKLRKEAKPTKYIMVPVCPCGEPAEQKVEHGMEVMHFCKECVSKLELKKVS